MKISVLLSIAATTFAFVENARADVTFPPGLTQGLPAGSDQASVDRYNALQGCMANASGNEQSLQNCVEKANNNYAAATAPAGEAPPAQGILDPAESDYYDVDGHKGFGNADQP